MSRDYGLAGFRPLVESSGFRALWLGRGRFGGWILEWASYPQLVAAAALAGMAYWPAAPVRGALLLDIVGARHISAANAMLLVAGAGGSVAPVIAGLCIERAGPAAALWFTAGCSVMACWALRRMVEPRRRREGATGGKRSNPNVYQSISGAEWCAALGRVAAAEPFGLIDGEWLHLADVDPGPPGRSAPRPDAIEVRCTIEQHGQTRTLALATDVALIGDPSTTGDDLTVFVAVGAKITGDELAELITQAAFSAWDDAESDSWETQHAVFREEACALAAGILISEDAALALRLHDRLREARWLLRGRAAVIRVPADGGAPEIQIDGVSVPAA